MEEFKGDKRTKKYKKWKAKFDKEQAKKSEGLGDSVEKVLKATGVDKLAKFIAGEDCGCDERKEALNKRFKYKKPNCLLEDEYLFLEDFFSVVRGKVSGKEKKVFYDIHNRVFNEKKDLTDCSSCVRSVVIQLKAVFDLYK